MQNLIKQTVFCKYFLFFLQTRQLEEDWRNLAAQQKRREQDLQNKENELILKREALEIERKGLLNEVRNSNLFFGLNCNVNVIIGVFLLFLLDSARMWSVARI